MRHEKTKRVCVACKWRFAVVSKPPPKMMEEVELGLATILDSQSATAVRPALRCIVVQYRQQGKAKANMEDFWKHFRSSVEELLDIGRYFEAF